MGQRICPTFNNLKTVAGTNSTSAEDGSTVEIFSVQTKWGGGAISVRIYINVFGPAGNFRDVLDTSRAGRENTRPPHYGAVDKFYFTHVGYSETEP